MSTPIRAVLLDCDGVLQHAVNDWVADIAALTGLGPEDGVPFERALAAADRSVLTGDRPLEPAVAEVLAAWELDVAPADLVRTFQHVEVDAEMLEVVRGLRRRGVVCGLGTNQHAERAAYMRRELGYGRDFDPIVISCEIGLAKPDPDYFRHAVERLDVAPAEVLFLDDVAANVEGAREAGLVAELFARGAGRPELDRILALHGLTEAVAA